MDIIKGENYAMIPFFSLDEADNSCKAYVNAICGSQDDFSSLENILQFTKGDKLRSPSTGSAFDYEKFANEKFTTLSLNDMDVDLLMGSPEEDLMENFFGNVWDLKGDFELDEFTKLSENSIHSDSEQKDAEFLLVSPVSHLPVPVKCEPVSNDCISDSSFLSPLSEVSTETLFGEVKNDSYEGHMYNDDVWVANRNRPVISHMDNDHCYSAPPPPSSPKREEEEDFNSSPCSPVSSTCSEVDVETIPLVPKITISVSRKRGRKPKVQKATKKQRTQSCQGGVSAKALRASLSKKSYVTKSGRVTKISNSVETTPSSSNQSSLHSSRCSSDNEDTVDKRASHNMAERNRRQELTNLFQHLRKKVPDIKNNPKASKVSILQSSTRFIKELEANERQLIQLKEQLQAELDKKIAIARSYNPGNSIKVENSIKESSS